MKPLATNQMMLTWLCFLPAEAAVSIQQKLAYLMAFLITFGVIVACFIGCWANLLKFLQIDLEKALYAVYEVSAGFGVIFMTLAALFQRYKMNSFFKGLQMIYDERKNPIDSDLKTDYISIPNHGRYFS